ncbi:ABC transporter ATP-binding protein [Robertkochia marina]|uniref:ABC transporter ATP-binding protein n=1 Tax=Robertkochia marina TaxID=1227945 RepID=A0A4S3M2H0_9FLAO|nr:ABC transporter ATP-binding protein [Robertkochia marina]THD69233.1 ABC transporter ATP-binding protein [Robertkochia marina]TRZ47508.1 ABC transporter ATP-binding protein [Robertkochia marina]
MLLVKNLSFAYKEKKVLHNINFTLEPGEQLSVIGESGSGKSTLLKTVYGLLQPATGTIFWKGKKLLGPDYNLVPGEDFIKYQAQDYDLMAPLTVAENVGKFLSNFYPRKKQQRIAELLELVGMSDFAQRRPDELSGGQQQRVALARVLAREPELLLLDEPFSNIDNFKKSALRRELFKYLKQQGIASIVATHENADSLSFSDHTLVMKNGKIVHRGHPSILYQKPKTKYVARLFGEVNQLPLSWFEEDKKGLVLVYPHELIPDADGHIIAIVSDSYFEGHSYLNKARVGRRNIFFRSEKGIPNEFAVNLRLKNGVLETRLNE